MPIRDRGLCTGGNQWHWSSLWVFPIVCATKDWGTIRHIVPARAGKKQVCTLQSLSQKYIQCIVAMGGLHIIDPAVTLTAAIKCDLYFYIKGKVSVDFSSIIMYDESA